MAKGKKASKGKKAPTKQMDKQSTKKDVLKSVETRRSTRGSSRAPPEEKQAQKRKASPSPALKKSSTVSKKTRSASPSAAPVARVKPGRGASASATKPSPPARQPRSSSKKKEDVRQTPVTRAVVGEFEIKSRNKGLSTPAKTAVSTKKTQEPATPTQRRGRSSTPRASVTPKTKEALKPKETHKAKEAPKKSETSKGRSVSSIGKELSPLQKSTPKTTSKRKAGTPKSRSVTPKATTPKQKPITPKQISAAEKTSPKRTTPKQKTPTQKKVTPSRKATPTSPEKPNPTKSTPTRSARASPRKSITPTKKERLAEEKVIEGQVLPTKETSESVDEIAENKEGPVAIKESDILEPQKDDSVEEDSEKEPMEVDPETPEETQEETIEAEEMEQSEPDEDTNVENDVVDNDLSIAIESEDVEDEGCQISKEAQKFELDKKIEQEREEESGADDGDKDGNIETEQHAEEAQEPEDDKIEEQAAKEEINETAEANSDIESTESDYKEVVEEEQEKVKDVVEQEVDKKDLEGVLQQTESEAVVNEKSEKSAIEGIDERVSNAEKDELEKASVVAQVDETEQMEEMVAGLGDGESDMGFDDVSMHEPVVEIGSGDVGEVKSTAESQYQASVQDVVEVPDGEVEESDVNTTGIEIAQEVVEVSDDSGDAVTNDLELNGIVPIQIGEGSSTLLNGEQPSQKRKHDEMDEENCQSTKRMRVSEDLENSEESYTNGGGSSESADITNDYVVIEMGDVPPSESQEVIESVPKETVQNFTSEENVINETQTVEQTATQSESNPVFRRVFIPNPNFGGSADSSKQFSIVSYNILADCHLFKNDYSFTHPDHLEPDYRLNKLMEEIQFLDADIVCLQEVDPDFYQDQLLPHMKGHGYEGFHKKRTEDFFDEGEATFYRTSRFTLVDVSLHRVADLVEKEFVDGMDPSVVAAVRRYMDRSDVLVITRLQCNNSGQQITVGNIHVTWGEMKVPDVQSLQIACAIKEIVSKAGAEAYPHIICGDFNSEPFSPGYLMAKDGYLSDEGTINKLQQLQNLQFPDGRTEALVNCLWSGFQHTSSSLKSVYLETQGVEPEITSYNRVMCACVDYQFYSSSSLDAVGVLQTASKERIMETGGTPNCFFPSDHVSMKAVFSFK